MAYLNGNEVLFSPKVLLGGSNGSAETLIEQNNETSLRFWVGSQAEYDAIETKDGNCFYIISDDPEKDEIYQRLVALEERDYVVEQGTNGIWTYRKWASGIAECWGSETVSFTPTTEWGSVYVEQELDEGKPNYGGIKLKIAYFPDGLFEDVETSSINLCDTGYLLMSCNTYCVYNGMGYWLASFIQREEVVKATAHYVVKGRWK